MPMTSRRMGRDCQCPLARLMARVRAGNAIVTHGFFNHGLGSASDGTALSSSLGAWLRKHPKILQITTAKLQREFLTFSCRPLLSTS